MFRIALLGAAALVLGSAANVASAQDAKPAAQLTEEQKAHGVETFRLIASAMQSQNVPDDVKSTLMGCIYGNPIGQISQTVDSALAANPGKVDRTKPDEMLGVIAQVCGYQPPAQTTPPAGGKAPAAGRGPAKPTGTAKGR